MNNPNEADSRLKWRQSHEAIKKKTKKKEASKTHRTVKWSRFGRLRLVKIQKVLLVEKKRFYQVETSAFSLRIFDFPSQSRRFVVKEQKFCN